MSSAFAESSRSSGQRGAHQLRPMKIKHEILSQADGSSSFAFGHQSCLGAVNGPMEVRIRDELTDRSTLEISFLPLDGLPGIAGTTFASALHSALCSVLLLHLHPRTLTQLTLQSTNHAAPRRTLPLTVTAGRRSIRPRQPHPDADLPTTERAALVNAAMLALVQAGVPCSATVCAVAVAVLPRRLARSLRPSGRGNGNEMDEDEDEDEDGHSDDAMVALVDPDPSEEACAGSTHVFAFACSGQVIRSDGSGSPASEESEAEARLVLAQSSGAVPLSTYTSCIRTARDAARSVHAAMRTSIQAQLAPHLLSVGVGVGVGRAES